MQRWMKTAAIGVVVAALGGCESAVLVNNRPDRDNHDWNQPAANPDNAQNASATVTPGNSDQPQPASVQVTPGTNTGEDRAATLTTPTTRPADQTVNTKNTRIESSSD